ncbi:hypothetical protein [Vibrio sp. 10N.247.311.51]|uniref:hypothetical protein n=1 Tax=Vibrio sp. 10N.247.311.51 TaxID=3229996 RepID=UPI003550CA85
MNKIILLLILASPLIVAKENNVQWYGAYTTDKIIDKDCVITDAVMISRWRFGKAIDFNDNSFADQVDAISNRIEIDMEEEAKEGGFNAIISYSENLEFAFDSNLEQSGNFKISGGQYYGDGIIFFKASGMGVIATCKDR